VIPAAAGASGRPNVVIILADDLGFSDVGCYGGEIRTPNIDRMAGEGVRVAQFYNAARCCPSRAALLTGLYPHQAGVGAMNQDLGRPAYRGELNDRCVTIAEVLRNAGYRTGMVGKWHLSHVNIAGAGARRAKAMLNFEADGPVTPSTKSWPVNRGFEEHWGTIPGVENYYDPYGLVHNEQVIKPDGKDFYYTDFITDHAVQLIDGYGRGDKPFFLCVAYTAPHWPMQAREADVQRYRDTYSVGWDAIREKRYARLLELGLIKPEWKLSPRAANPTQNDAASNGRPKDSAPEKVRQALRQAVYAAMVEAMDRGVGRIMEALKSRGADDNTLVMFLSDNGGCQENVQPAWYDIPSRTRTGETIHVGNDPRFMPGPEQVYQSYGPAWANASNTPFRRFKHLTEEGGISAPFIARWPAAKLAAGSIRHAGFGHVIDLMPTALEVAGAAYPKTYDDRAITPPEGKSLLPLIRGETFNDRGVVCWEHEGNRAARHGDWKLLAPHRENWQLFNLATDRTELHDLSNDYPERVAELKAAYEQWARRCGVEEWPVRRPGP
jgi:arylsulfatase